MSGTINVGVGQTGTISNSGTYSSASVLALGTLDVTGASASPINVTISTLSLAAASSINVTQADLVVGGVSAIGVGDSYILDAGGTLDLAPTITAGVAAPVVFNGPSAELVVEPGLNAGVLSATSGFALTDSVDFRGVAAATSAQYANGTLTLLNGTMTVASAVVGGTLAPATFGVTSDGVSGFVVTACFAAGTRILTQDGEIAVEHLTEGMLVPTLLGHRLSRIRWIGIRSVACNHHPRPDDVWPVRIAPGAFGDGLPIRSLQLSPDHSVYVDGALTPIRYLVNGATIVQVPVQSVTYYHVELDRHDILVADGLPAESYLDTGNRAAFSNGGCVSMAHPDFALRTWETESCAKLVVGGAALEAVRERLARRAGELGFRRTAEPSPRLDTMNGAKPYPLAEHWKHLDVQEMADEGAPAGLDLKARAAW